MAQKNTNRKNKLTKVLAITAMSAIISTSVSTPQLGSTTTLAASTSVNVINEKEQTLRFNDIGSKHVYTKQIHEMRKQGIINGYEGNVFKPNDNIQKRHAAALIYRAVEINNLDVKPTVKFVQPKDLVKTNPYFDEIKYLMERGLLKADKNGNINPTKSLTRGEMAKILATIFELEVKATYVFGDVKDADMIDAVQKLYSNGVTTGYDDNTFRENNPLTRAHYAVFMYRAMNIDEDYVAKPIEPIITTPSKPVEPTKPTPTEPSKPVEKPVEEKPVEQKPTPKPPALDLPPGHVPADTSKLTIKPIDKNDDGFGIEFDLADSVALKSKPTNKKENDKQLAALSASNQFNRHGSLVPFKEAYAPYNPSMKSTYERMLEIQVISLYTDLETFMAAINYVIKTGEVYNGGTYAMYYDYQNRHIVMSSR